MDAVGIGLVIAGVGAVAGLLGVWVAWKGRKTGPQVRCEWSWKWLDTHGPDYPKEGPFLCVTAINDGSENVQIRAWGIAPGDDPETDIRQDEMDEGDDVYGQKLPHTLPAYHSANWYCLVGTPSPQNPLHPYVRLGTQAKIRARKAVTAPYQEPT